MKFSVIFFTALIALCAFAHASAIPCTYQWQCQQVTEEYNFVACVDGSCRCLLESGFHGQATVEDKCSCDASLDREVVWKNGQPLCISYEGAVENQLAVERNAILRAQTRRVYESLVWPLPYLIVTNLQQGDTSLMDDIFAVDAHGRIDPVGTFSDFQGVVEYFYGSVWLPFSRVGAVYFHDVTAEGDFASVRVDVLIQNVDPASGTILSETNLTESGTFYFNKEGLIKGAEMVIHRMAKSSEGKFPEGEAFIQLVCGLILAPPAQGGAGCTAEHDPEGYYTDFADCAAHMASIDFGTLGDVPMNSVVCRYYHATLAIANPFLHCSHSGKTGGGKCIDHTYEEYFNVQYLN